MAGKLIELKDAAAQLGITPERLQELREAGKIHGYKDGSSWKFKPAEIERLGGELSSQIAAGDDALDLGDSASFSGDDFDQLLNLDAAADGDDELENSSILISEELSPKGVHDSSSTVIGKDGIERLQESDLGLADASSVDASAGDDELKLAASEDLSDELGLADDLGFESDEALVLHDDSDLGLADDDDDLVLDESGSSEDGALEVGVDDSGIGLAKPSDSGLSLEEDASLELPEDDDMISLNDELGLASDDSAHLQQDEEFLLSPSDEMLGDESSDSGSQVIALDDSGAFESDSDVVALDSAEPMLVEEPNGLDVQLEPIDGAVAVASTIPIASADAPEAGYTIWNILALLLVVVLLSVSGMLMTDVVRNMWTWNGDIGPASGLASSIVSALGMN